MFADDLNFFSNITDLNSSALLPNAIVALESWCHINQLPLNIEKCFIITFTRCRSPLLVNYHVLNSTIKRRFIIKDLGVILDYRLSFNDHIDYMVKKANRSWGIIRRYSSDISDPYVIKTLYVSFVRSILEYCSIIWSLYYAVHINRIKAVQKRFLRFTLRGLPWLDPTTLPPYSSRLQLIGLHPLVRRRLICRVVFIFRLFLGLIDCPFLLNSLNPQIPFSRLRNTRFFSTVNPRTNYARSSSLHGIIDDFNLFSNVFKFNESPISLIRSLLNSFTCQS